MMPSRSSLPGHQRVESPRSLSKLSCFPTTMRLSLSLFAASLLALSASASNVLDLADPAVFEETIGKGTPALVEL